jgi:hypothetical protein
VDQARLGLVGVNQICSLEIDSNLSRSYFFFIFDFGERIWELVELAHGPIGVGFFFDYFRSDLCTAQTMIYVKHETTEEDDDSRDSKRNLNSKLRCRKDC